jgi:hypothetical protein
MNSNPQKDLKDIQQRSAALSRVKNPQDNFIPILQAAWLRSRS